MSERQLPELALTEEEVDEILRICNGRALLVGGQALAFWAQHYRIPPLGVLGANITSDVDFFGSAEVARELAEALRPAGWRYRRPAMDDGTTNTVKLSKRIEGQGVKQIDFLGSVLGLEAERIQRRAVTVHLGDCRLLVLHPLDVLQSRVKNLAALPSKRHPRGVEQARLAIDVMRHYLQQLVDEGNTRLLLKAIEEVAGIARDKSFDRVFHDFELNPLAAVPADQVLSEEFRVHRWPQIVALVEDQRRRYARRRRRQTRREK